MIEVKEAVKQAKDFLKKVFYSENLYNLLLEEVELDENDENWLITLGFDREVPPPRSGLATLIDAAVLNPETERVYKIIKVDAETGEAQSMKIRSI